MTDRPTNGGRGVGCRPRPTPLSRWRAARVTRATTWAAKQRDQQLRAAVRRTRGARARLRSHAAYVELCDRAIDALVADDEPPDWVTDILGPLPTHDDDLGLWWEAAFRLATERVFDAEV